MIVLRSARSYFIHLIFIVSSKFFSFLYSFGLFDLSNSVCHVVEGNNWVVSRIGSLFLTTISIIHQVSNIISPNILSFPFQGHTLWFPSFVVAMA